METQPRSPVRQLETVLRELAKLEPGHTAKEIYRRQHLRRSKRRVPHLVIEIHPGEPALSVAYFGRAEFFRAFYPWPAIGVDQRKWDFDTAKEVVDFVIEARAGQIDLAESS